ncbi:MAG: hypothetical protein ACOH2A_01465 [Sphingobacteriaceae bacterium]
MKKTLVFILLLQFLFIGAKAQIGFNYHEYSLGVGAGITKTYAGVSKVQTKSAFHADFDYYYTPFVSFGVQGQMGTLAGGDRETDRLSRAFTNKYNSLILQGNLQAGEFIDYSNNMIFNALKNFYLGTGVGLIFNNITYIERVSAINPETYYDGPDKSTNLLVPLKFGYEFKVFNAFDEPQLRVDLSYQTNIVFDQGLDGYNSPSHKPNVYNYISVGLKYGFGSITSARKPIK